MATYIIPSAATELLDNLEINADTEAQALLEAVATFENALAAFGLVKEQTGEDDDN